MGAYHKNDMVVVEGVLGNMEIYSVTNDDAQQIENVKEKAEAMAASMMLIATDE